MSNIVVSIVATLVGVGTPCYALADPIPGLYNTGIDASGQRITTNGVQDAHYRVNGALAVSYYNPAYYPTSDSQWIGQYPDGGYSATFENGVARTTYTLTFDLTGLNPDTARITGSWGVDNYGILLVNGVQHSRNTVGFAGPTEFTITSGFKKGINTLTFVVEDYGPPAAFVVSGLSGTADKATPPTWITGPYGDWTSTCGTATHSRSVTCIDPDSGETLQDAFCQAPKPSTSESSYQTSGCGYDWIPSAWSAVAPACGASTQTRTLSCRRTDGETVDNSMCAPGTMPATTQAATDYSRCGYDWTVGSYGAPTTTCGQATQTRSVTCTRSDATQVQDSYCGAASRPTSQQSTYQTSGCGYAWKTGAFGVVADACGPSTSTREVWCERSDGQKVDDASCSGQKPSTTQAGTSYATCGYDWAVGPWGAPTSTCGDATETRTVTCRRTDGTDVADASCAAAGAKPEATRSSHQITGCTTDWSAGPFGAPIPACGSTTQSRTVTCLRTDGQTVDDAACQGAKPPATQAATDYSTCSFAWSAGEWTTPGACGTTTRTRAVSCVRSDLTAAPERSCNSATRPSASEEVADTSTCTYSWAQTGMGEWGACASGTQTRTIEVACRRVDGASAADTACTGAKPAVSESRSCGAAPTPTPAPATGDVVVFRRPIPNAARNR
jgi:thrombospondin motif-containing protein 9